MKRVVFIFTTVLATMFLTKIGNAQFTFSVSPGLHLNGAAFGYKAGNMVIYGGLQMLGMEYKQIHEWKDFDDNGVLQNYSNTRTVSLYFFEPSLGIKFFLKENGKLKLYANGLLSYLIPVAKITDSDDSSANSDFKKTFKKFYALGGLLGFGSEYFFDEKFSIGGEFGITLISNGYMSEYDRTIYDYNTGNSVNTTETYTYKQSYIPTYVKITFNFYFSKNENNKELSGVSE